MTTFVCAACSTELPDEDHGAEDGVCFECEAAPSGGAAA